MTDDMIRLAEQLGIIQGKLDALQPMVSSISRIEASLSAVQENIQHLRENDKAHAQEAKDMKKDIAALDQRIDDEVSIRNRRLIYIMIVLILMSVALGLEKLIPFLIAAL